VIVSLLTLARNPSFPYLTPPPAVANAIDEDVLPTWLRTEPRYPRHGTDKALDFFFVMPCQPQAQPHDFPVGAYYMTSRAPTVSGCGFCFLACSYC